MATTAETLHQGQRVRVAALGIPDFGTVRFVTPADADGAVAVFVTEGRQKGTPVGCGPVPYSFKADPSSPPTTAALATGRLAQLASPDLAASRGTRPRDLRGSYVTLRVYEGTPLTEIARHVGTSVAMLDRHYAGVIANWDGKRVPADEQISRARVASTAGAVPNVVAEDAHP